MNFHRDSKKRKIDARQGSDMESFETKVQDDDMDEDETDSYGIIHDIENGCSSVV